MSELNSFSIVTLALFFLFVVHPLSLYVRLPIIGRMRFTIASLVILATIIFKLWAAEVQCNATSQDRDGIAETGPFPKVLCLFHWTTFGCSVDTKPHNILILCLSVAIIAILLHVTGVLEGNGAQKLYHLYEVLSTPITAPLLPEMPLSSTPTGTAAAPGAINDNDVRGTEAQSGVGVEGGAPLIPDTSLVTPPATPPPSLIVSDMILGTIYPSHPPHF